MMTKTKKRRAPNVRVTNSRETRAAIRAGKEPGVLARMMAGEPLNGKPKLELRPGGFYRAKSGAIWCCYDVDNSAPEHARAYCILTPGRGAHPRTEYFYFDGRYDAEGKREHTLVAEVDPITRKDI